ncbi:MAG: HAD-IC family P-type ATPase [Synechococcaceae cyanobacterium]|nr:HAD-IC family P-type ATPase [Synechococcaceae cyanobacterium]
MEESHEAPVPSWHALDLPTVASLVGAGVDGLGENEVRRRFEREGPNRLPRARPPGIGRTLLRQFRGPLIAVLAVAAGVSAAIGDFKDAGFILAVLLINALVGGIQEWRAERHSQALQRLLRVRAVVRRDGEVREIDAEELVPGDLVWLESGNRVPADLRLLHAHNLEVDESLLSGESLAVLKADRWLGQAETPLADRRNMAFAGSTVVRGRGRGLVVATGATTVVGRLAVDVLSRPAGRPPLLRRMERFSRVIGFAVMVAALAVALVGALRHGHSPHEMFLFAVALAVSAIPEGLPVALTVALAVATRRMAQRRLIVRRLPAVEGLGSCTLIACDKTGTLTCNELTARCVVLADGRRFKVSGEGFAPLGEVVLEADPEAEIPTALGSIARAAVLCNEADLHPGERAGTWFWRGDPTDIALLCLAHKLGTTREAELERHPRINEIPFEPEHRFAASFHSFGSGKVRVVVKGAPERLLPMCLPTPGLPAPADLAHGMAREGFRVLALAEGPAGADLDPSLAPPQPRGLTLLGFVGMIDPLRAGAREAIRDCHRAGITVWMVTGDHPTTALAIARNLGLARHRSAVVTGGDLERWPPDQLGHRVARAQVFARMAPHQKLQLVQAAQAAGHVVAVTGDGVNDAPALRAADIGVAMGRGGTDVAREAAELVLADDDFATIVAGVEEGRIASANVRKVIYLLVSTGAAEIVLIALAVAWGLPLPLLPVQLLWLNLVTNGIQDVALAFEPGEGDVLRRSPRPPREPIFNRLMIERTLLAAAVMGGVAFATFLRLLHAGWSTHEARNGLLLLMVLFENVHLGNCRSESRSVFTLSPLRSPALLAGTGTAICLHVLLMHLPIGHALLGMGPVSLDLWLRLLGLSLSVLVVVEIDKARRRRGSRRASSASRP